MIIHVKKPLLSFSAFTYLLAHSFIVTLIKIVKKATKALRRREAAMYDKLKSDPHLCLSVTQYALYARKEITTAKYNF